VQAIKHRSRNRIPEPFRHFSILSQDCLSQIVFNCLRCSACDPTNLSLARTRGLLGIRELLQAL
jgi:hypothetical protein